jgi:chemotaxis protein methyltransferase CheR
VRPSLTDAEFARLQRLLARAAGLVFDAARRDSLAYSIAERLREVGGDVPAYLERVDGDAVELQRLLDEVTIQETHFFRNPPQVRAMRAHVLPDLLRHAEAHGRRLRVWSAGCSTGEEPYSTAMMLRELLPSTAGWDVKVVATDVSERALEAARAGRYGPRAVQMATPEELARFFVSHPDGSHEVRAEVRELVEFRHHNLVTEPVPFAPDERVDLVLCRNVTIYFSRETTRELMARLHAALRDGGYLFLGHSETLWQVSEDFRLVPLGSGDSAAFVYRRLDGPSAERRAVLPDRRTLDEGPPPPLDERRHQQRRAAVWEALTKPRAVGLPRTPSAREPLAAVPSPAPPPDAPAVSAAAVRALLSDGRYADAAGMAADLVALDPLRAESHYLRGLALVNQGHDVEALVDLRKAVYLDAAAGLAHFLLAGVLARLGDASAAAREYRAAADTLGRQPGDATAPELGGRSVHDLVALCEQLEGQLSEAAG